MGFVSWDDTFEGKKGTGKEKVLESELIKEFRSLGLALDSASAGTLADDANTITP